MNDQKKRHRSLSLKLAAHGLITAMAMFVLLTISSEPLLAQITRSAKIVLEPSDHSFYLGDAIYVTKDGDGKLTPNTLVERHENNLRGERQSTSIIHLGAVPETSWLVFSVINNAKTEDWVLDFGNVMDGRMMGIQALELYNFSAQAVIAKLPGDDNKVPQSGMTIPLKLPKNQETLLVLKLVPQGAMPATITPRLVTQQSYLGQRFYLDLPLVISTALFVLAIGFFCVLSIFSRSFEYLWFAFYYGLHLLLFALINTVFIMPLSFMGQVFTGLFLFANMVGVSQSKAFLALRDEEYTENMTLLLLNIGIPVCFLLNLFIIDQHHFVNDILIFAPPIVMSLSLCIMSFVQAQKGKYAGQPYAIGWAVTCFGALITTLMNAGLLKPAFLTVNAYWIFLLPQMIFFIWAARRKSDMVREERKAEAARQQRAEQSLARLKQSKESADQARLLRVIERERELMADLREREMQRTEEMRRAKEMADEANRAKSAFLAVVSHEIRTPMTGIMGIVRLMADTKMSKEQNEYILAVQKSGDTMMALLNDILDFEKIETGNMRLEEIDFDLPKLVQGVVTLMSGHAADKKITLKSDISNDVPRFVMGDPTRLRQVLLNLVNNAIKFTEKGNVTIRLRATPHDSNGTEKKPNRYDVYFAVEDTGVGISEEAQRNLFNPFEQADATISRKYGGTGLGLAICQRLIEAMNSTIQISSELGKGSTFYFSINMNEGDSEKSAESDTLAFSAPQESAPIGLRILVIEDNEINRKVLQNFLEKDRHHVLVSESGEEAIEICGREQLDVIFTDINLTGMSGLETTRTIRTMPNKKIAQTPIVAITGNVTDEDRKRCLEAGINDLLGKPIDYDSLRQILANLPELRQKNASAQSPVPRTVAPKATTSGDSIAGMKPPSAPRPQPKPAAPTAAPAKTVPAADNANTDAKNSSAKEQARRGDPSYNEDNAVAPIHAYMKQLKKSQGISTDFDEDTFSASLALEDENQAEENSAGICDFNVLQGLLDALGREQMDELLKGFMDKADEIIESLDKQQRLQDATAIRERAHELKGMAANFGITELSQIAGKAEKAAQNKDVQAALEHSQKLPIANQKAKTTLKNWLAKAPAKATS